MAVSREMTFAYQESDHIDQHQDDVDHAFEIVFEEVAKLYALYAQLKANFSIDS